MGLHPIPPNLTRSSAKNIRIAVTDIPFVRNTRAEVDLPALRHNLSQARALAGKASVLAVVKANAYGHGAVPVARCLEQSGVGLLGVALVEEGIELRNAGVKAPIVVL